MTLSCVTSNTGYENQFDQHKNISHTHTHKETLNTPIIPRHHDDPRIQQIHKLHVTENKTRLSHKTIDNLAQN